jgi:hypothetical protein
VPDPIERSQPVLEPQAADADRLEALRATLPRGQSCFRERTPVDAQGGEAARPPVVGERVEERIRRSVVALSRRAEKTRRGAVQDEEIELFALRQLVQVQRAADLRRHHRSQPLWRLLQEQPVVEDPGGVDHTADRRTRPFHFVEHALELGAIRDVCLG